MDWNTLTSEAAQCMGVVLAAVIAVDSTGESEPLSVRGDIQSLDVAAACAYMTAVAGEAECTLRSLEDIPGELHDPTEEILLTTEGHCHLALAIPSGREALGALLLYVVFEPERSHTAVLRAKLRKLLFPTPGMRGGR